MEIAGTRYVVDGVAVFVCGFDDMGEEEMKKYLAYVRSKVKAPLLRLTISPAKDGKVALDYSCEGVRFERIRRITGYLVGTIDRWNNAKRSEERDRVKHDAYLNEGGSAGQ